MCNVTTLTFLAGMLEIMRDLKMDPAEDIWLYGRKRGWLEEQDQLWKDRMIEKRHAARIVHEFLRIEGKEKDERDIKKARQLEDLYHCRVCANHIAQVFVKGIMQARTEKRFGLLDPISETEMEMIFLRMKEILLKDHI